MYLFSRNVCFGNIRAFRERGKHDGAIGLVGFLHVVGVVKGEGGVVDEVGGGGVLHFLGMVGAVGALLLTNATYFNALYIFTYIRTPCTFSVSNISAHLGKLRHNRPIHHWMQI